MLGKKLTAIVVLAIGLGGCASNSKLESFYHVRDDVAQLPDGSERSIRIEASSVETTFSDGQTGNLVYVKWLNTSTNKVVNEATYAFPGKSLERVGFENFTGSIIPAAEAAGGWTGAALLSKPMQITNQGATAISRAAANAGSSTKLVVH